MPMKHTTLIVSLCAALAMAGCQRKDNQENKQMGSRDEAPPAATAPQNAAAPEPAANGGEKVALANDDEMPAVGPASVRDAAITANVSAAINSDPTLARQPIKVQTHDGVVSLAGTVDSVAASQHAAALAAEVDGVVNVDNRLNLMVSR
ncbi:MAG: BON domain-containing protein [Gammaproteobacteria bacterium]|nr:BON domain-containing protein [Gammaproteobacteria bacterium]